MATFPKNKQEELAKTAQESSRNDKKIQISLNGKVVDLHAPFPVSPAGETPHVGHSLKVAYASPDDAFAMARELIEKKGP